MSRVIASHALFSIHWMIPVEVYLSAVRIQFMAPMGFIGLQLRFQRLVFDRLRWPVAFVQRFGENISAYATSRLHDTPTPNQ